MEALWILLGFACMAAWLAMRVRHFKREGRPLVLPGVPWYAYIIGCLCAGSLAYGAASAGLAAERSFDAAWRLFCAGMCLAAAVAFLWPLKWARDARV
jgi:hypothetical protein